MRRVGVVGARGHVGAELLPMLFRHPDVEVAWVTSRALAGAEVPGAGGLVYSPNDPGLLARAPVDAVLLALPNGESGAWVTATTNEVVVDLSSDHRFHPSWAYGQPERFRSALRDARRIASPGCYATAAQLAIAPLMSRARGAFHVFGVSGYSGAGTTPSERNDPEVLRDNILPYALVGHTHERELRRHLGSTVYFAPHVGPFFRGLVVTVSAELDRPTDADALAALYREAYGAEPFVELTPHPPRPRDTVGSHVVAIGGLSLDDDRRHLVVVAALDNLLAGAASQALRAMNLALGLGEAAGLTKENGT